MGILKTVYNRIFKMIWNSIKRRGLLRTMYSIVVDQIVDRMFDMKYGTNTVSWLKLDELKINSGNMELCISQAKPWH